MSLLKCCVFNKVKFLGLGCGLEYNILIITRSPSFNFIGGAGFFAVSTLVPLKLKAMPGFFNGCVTFDDFFAAGSSEEFSAERRLSPAC